jgi:hypothetical protein
MAAHGKKKAAIGKDAKARGRSRVVRKRVSPETIEQRLIAKAEAADRHDYAGERSLGQMSREERHRYLFGE